MYSSKGGSHVHVFIIFENHVFHVSF